MELRKSPQRKRSPFIQMPTHKWVLQKPKSPTRRPSILLKQLDAQQLQQLKTMFGTNYIDYIEGYTLSNPRNTVDGVLGKGKFGTVYALDKPNASPRIIKFMNLSNPRIRDSYNTEVATNLELTKQEVSFTPWIHAYGTYTHGNMLIGILVTDRISMNLGQFLSSYELTPAYRNILYKDLLAIIDGMCSVGIVHTDLHFDNIGVVLDNKTLSFQIIDWGSSIQHPCDPCLEIARLIFAYYRYIEQGFPMLENNKRPLETVLMRLWDVFNCYEHEEDIQKEGKDPSIYWNFVFDKLYFNLEDEMDDTYR